MSRRQARQSLAAYIDYLDLGIVPALHHRLLIDELEGLFRGEYERLAIFMPPGSAKSTYATVLYPPWYLGRNPGVAVLGCSNTTTLAEHFSRRSRNIVASPQHQAVFGDPLSQDSSAAGSWETAGGGSYFAAGVGATITGRRADLGIIDDPVKSREEADSESIRQKHWDWYLNDFLTRLKPNARQLLIQTRWHEDDLAGRILQRDGRKWRVVKLAMEAGDDDPLGRNPGDRLWADWFTEEMVEEAKLNQRSWSALYQQEPSPETGTFFQRDWFWFYDPASVPAVRKYLTSDFAVTEKQEADFTELGIHGVAQEDGRSKLYLGIDGWYGKQDPSQWMEQYLNLVLRHRPIAEFGESGVIRRSIEPFLNRRRLERKAHGRVEWLPSIHDKQARASSLRAMASMGLVGLPDNDYGQRLLHQLLGFPTAKHDDAVDMLGMLPRALDMAHPAVGKTAAPTRRRDAWDSEFEDDRNESWRV